MRTLFFKNALLPSGWAQDVQIECGPDGRISKVSTGVTTRSADGGIAVPGMANLHSHAFQRAMAGLAEWRAAGDDSFWSWREVMYQFLARLQPEDMQAIAAQLYAEMLEAGFTVVGEFHYLHHQPDGTPYKDPSEMAQRLLAAADETGIGQTLLPVCYSHSDFGGKPIADTQKRFHNEPDAFLRLVETCRRKTANSRTVVGIAPHSLRAVSPEGLKTLLEATAAGPIHIHIAEQTKEVESCLAWSGKRPVEWLFAQHRVNKRWCLVHATHMQPHETRLLAESGAVAGLCPTTEANLGDGIFDGVSYRQAGGLWGIGSDSHIRIDLAEELRAYEYSQRLRDRKRNQLANKGEATGRALFNAALTGGAQALDQPMGHLSTGQYCDIVALDPGHPLLAGRSGDNLLNSWIFAGDKSCVKNVWVSGKQVVANGRHKNQEAIRTRYTAAIQRLTHT